MENKIEKVWLKEYPEGVPAEIDPDSIPTIIDLIQQSCQKYASLPAYYSLGITLTYKEIDEHSRDFAAYLQQVLKIKKGERIALMLPNIMQYPVVLFGALRAGLTVVNVNPLYTPRELIYQLKDSVTETIVVLDNFAQTVQKAISETRLKNVIVTHIGDYFSLPKALLTHFFLKYIKKKIPKWHIANAIYFKKTLQIGKKYNLDSVDVKPNDIAFLQYTGGTTGISKGAVLTHRNIIANVLQAEAWFKPVIKPGGEIAMTALPLYHIFALLANCIFMLKIGALSVLIINPRDITQMMSEIAKFPFTFITGVNTLFNALLNQPKFLRLNFKALKVSLGGGMAVQKAVADRWESVTGNTLIEAYGLTETSPCVTVNPYNLKHYNGSIGLPVSSTLVCILDEEEKVVPYGKSGELAIKGPQVMPEYWNNPEETKKVFTGDGWLLTGDIATMDEQGYVRILERKKDLILVSGFNVYPNEIEDVLVQMPGVHEAAVIGIPDPYSGEAVKAFIVKKDPDLTEQQIIDFCHQNLTGYKIPKLIEFRSDLPKTNVGKILRRALREQKLPFRPQ